MIDSVINQGKDIRKHLLSVLKGGDILFIVPPFVRREYSILGPHILQSLAEEEGYKADILYLNILLASVLGEQTYDDICDFPTNLHWRMLGERLFARSAHGFSALGKFPELITDEAMCITGDTQQHVRMSYTEQNLDLECLLRIEEMCTSFVHEIVQVLSSINYKMIGCTTMLEQNNCSVAILNGIKEIRPNIITLIGGTNCEGKMAEGIASLSEAIDHVFSGESDVSFKEFLKGYSEGKLPSQRIITGESLRDLNTLPLPNYESFFKQMRLFLGENVPKQMAISYETSRGCWWGQKQKCSFCGLNGDAHRIMFRQKSEEKVKKELEQIVNRYPVAGIMMTDNIMPHSYYKKLLPFLSEKKEFPVLWYEEKANLKLKDLIHLKKARITSLLLGIESLSTGLLKLMNKGISARQNLLMLRNAMSVGIYVQWYMLWGFPGDKVAHYEETLKLLPLIRHFHPPREFVHLELARFSSYVEHPQYHQITNLRPWEIYKTIYPDWAEIDKLAYYFRGDYPCEAHENPEIIQKIVNEITVWRESWETSILAMIPFAGYYVIHDSRGINGENQSHPLEYPQAQEIMRCCTYNESEYQQWAVAQKLGAVVDSWYVPLVTASPELLLQFEGNNSVHETHELHEKKHNNT